MFGHHHEYAQATVLYAEDVSGNWEDRAHSKIEFVLEVRTSTGQTFRAKTTHHFITFTPYPQVGDVVQVKYDLKSLHVELDLRHDDRYGATGVEHKRQAELAADEIRRDALLAAPPGTPISPAPAPGGAGMVSPDPVLLERLRLAEAEFQAVQAGTAPHINPQAEMAWEEARALRGELKHIGVSGQATILRKQRMGEPFHHHTPFLVEVLVQPDNSGSPFSCSFIAWVDANKEALTRDSTLPVTYDPQNPARMVFLLPS